jgi:hypothetical protein
MCVRALDDLERPVAGGGDRAGRLRSPVTGVGEDPLDEWKALARSPEKGADAVAVLNVGGKDLDAQQQAERVDENVPLAAGDFLGRIVTLRVLRPPFCAALALWLSSTAALGLPSRPSRSRTAR